MEIVSSISNAKPGAWQAPESPTLQPRSWASINGSPAYLERLNLPDLDELDKKYRYMQSDLVEEYKRAALEATDPSTYSLDEDYDDYHDAPPQAGISQADILAQAQSIFSAKFPNFANRRVNPKPAVKFKPRWNSSTDVDNINQLADDVEQPPEPPAPKRGRKPKVAIDVEKPEQSEPPKRGRKPKAVKIVNESEQHEPPKRGKKRKAVDDIEVLADAASLKSTFDVRIVKRLRADSDKENESVPKRKDLSISSMPYRLTESVRRPLPPAMNMSRKRTVKEINGSQAGSPKRMTYNTQQAETETAQSPAAQELTSLSEDRLQGAQKFPFARPEGQANKGPAYTESSEPVAIRMHSKRLRQQFPTDSFSDEGALFEELLSQQVDDDDDDDEQVVGDVFVEDPSGNPLTLTPSSTISVLSPAPSTQQATISVPTSTVKPASTASSLTSQPLVQPSVRGKPTSMADESSNVPGTQPQDRIITCFRVAEALRIRSNAIAAPIPISAGSESSSPITIELFARIHLTYRECATQVFVFEDVFFPNKLPVLRAIHQSWQRCEQEAATLLRHNPQHPVEGGFLCRAVVKLDTNLPRNLNDPLQGEVTGLRVAEWSEIKRVRGIVDPKYQDDE